MKKFLKKLFFLVSLSAVFLSCKSPTSEGNSDSSKILKMERNIRYDKDGNIKSEMYSSYNTDAELETILWFIEGKFYNKLVYYYDENGNRIVIESFYSPEAFSFVNEYEYDEKNNMTKKLIYDSNACLSKIYTYEYDDKNNLIKENYYLPSDRENPEQIISYIYDNKNQLSSETTVLHGNTVQVINHFYDENGRIIKDEYEDADKKVVNKNEYKYRVEGDLTVEECYEYDDGKTLSKKMVRKYDYSISKDTPVFYFEYDGAEKITRKEESSFNSDGKVKTNKIYEDGIHYSGEVVTTYFYY